MIIWITGISGVGKTTLAKSIYKIFKKKLNNIIHIDGDEFRNLFKNDLGFSIKDRNINAERLISFADYINKQKINVIVSANLTSPKYLKIAKKKFKKFFHIHLESPITILKKRDPKKIYKKNKDVVGLQLKFNQYKKSDFYFYNDKFKKNLLKQSKIIFKILKKKLNDI